MLRFIAGSIAADRASYPELSARATWKLKQLSLMSTAATNTRPAYDDLQRDLELVSPAEVERLAISCIDAGLLDAKLNQVSPIARGEAWAPHPQLVLDVGPIRECRSLVLTPLPPHPCLALPRYPCALLPQRESVVEVRSVRGRDLAVEDIPASLAKLDAWQAAIKASIARLEAEAGRASANYAAGQEMAGAVEEVLGQAVVRAATAEPEASKSRRGGPGGYGDGSGTMGMVGGMLSRMGMGIGRRDTRRR